MKLDRLLRPRSIAVFGGSDAEQVIEQCDRFGYTGEIWPVSPSRATLAGRRCLRAADELPGVPDAAFVGVNRTKSIAVVEALAKAGAGGVVCYASGFSEAVHEGGNGRALQRALVEAAGAMPLLGPNCYGLINYADGALLWPNQHGGRRLEAGARGVAIVTQSSNLAINMSMQRRGLPVAYFVTAGNQAQLGLSEIASGLLEDDRVTAVGLHIEGFDDVRAFESMAMRARALAKPVVAIKIGRTEQSRAAAVSHTASLTGSDAAAGAFLRRLGVARLHDVPSFLEALKLLHVCGPLGGFSLSSMSCSGGEASLVADAVAGTRLCFPPLDAAARERVTRALGPLVSPSNPLDYHTFVWRDEPATRAAFDAMTESGFDLNLLMLDFPREDRCSDEEWGAPLRAFTASLERFGAKGAIVATLPENMPERRADELVARGVAPLCGIEPGLRALEAAAAVGEVWRGDVPPPLLGAPGASPDEGRMLDEDEAKALLSRHGVSVPAGRRVTGAAEAAAVAGDLGFPVAVKALGIAHKTEANAVRLALGDAGAVRDAAQELLARASAVLVERMVANPVAEMLVGVTLDAQFGPVLTLGSGGADAERLRDTATLTLPTARGDVERAMASLALRPLIEGFRGAPAADLEAAVGAVLAVAAFADGRAGTVIELDVNPLIVCPKGEGAWAADALLCLAGGDGEVGRTA